jgi:hypothetical protein
MVKYSWMIFFAEEISFIQVLSKDFVFLVPSIEPSLLPKQLKFLLAFLPNKKLSLSELYSF